MNSVYTTAYTIDDFINDRISVLVMKDDVASFLRFCEEHGLKWSGGELPTQFVPDCPKHAVGVQFFNRKEWGYVMTYSCFYSEHFSDADVEGKGPAVHWHSLDNEKSLQNVDSDELFKLLNM